jgi:hypothetical protein
MKILHNHLGYECSAAKVAVVRTSNKLEASNFSLLRYPGGEAVFHGEVRAAGSVDKWRDWTFYTLDFSAFTEPGEYYLHVETGSAPRPYDASISFPFEIGNDLLYKKTLTDCIDYFKTQRSSGRFDRKDRQAAFVGDREDRVDVHGGWFDASGDTSKYLSHLSYANFMNPQQAPLLVWNLAQCAQDLTGRSDVLAPNLQRRLLDEAAHGGDFLVRMFDPSGYFYMTVFDKWTKELDRRTICAYATQQGYKYPSYQSGFRQGGGLAIAALARLAHMGVVGEYDPARYLTTAIAAFDHLEVHNSEYLDDHQENIIDDYCALVAATELFVATTEHRFMAAARRRAQQLLARQSKDAQFDGWFRAGPNDERPFFHAVEAGFPVLALTHYAQIEGDATARQAAISAIRRAMEHELKITALRTNPFGVARQYVKPLDGPKFDAFFIPHSNESGYWWQGENARLASMAAAARTARKLFGDDLSFANKLERYASAQLDWILGNNPFDLCMLHGHGRNNPVYEEAFPSSCGGICNGITSGFLDEHDIDFAPASVAGRGDQIWRWGEQWTPHAAWYILALARGLA